MMQSQDELKHAPERKGRTARGQIWWLWSEQLECFVNGLFKFDPKGGSKRQRKLSKDNQELPQEKEPLKPLCQHIDRLMRVSYSFSVCNKG